ncbi:MAG: cobalt ECF transporter T component CbiQ [Cyanobacteria bacterium J06642_2]
MAVRRPALDAYCHLDSPIHRWEPRAKLIGITLLIFAFACVRQLALLPALLLVSLSLYGLARLPWQFWRDRLRLPGTLLLCMLVILPFVSGGVLLASWGPLSIYRDGCFAILPIACRFVSILTLGLIAFGTMPFATLIEAMRALGLPSVLADMTLLSYRYLDDTGSMFVQMRQAMQLRGWQGDRCSWQQIPVLASVAGTLLIRSFERSEQVYRAMVLRGYGRAQALSRLQPPQLRDIGATVWVALTAVAIVGLEWHLRSGLKVAWGG